MSFSAQKALFADPVPEIVSELNFYLLHVHQTKGKLSYLTTQSVSTHCISLNHNVWCNDGMEMCDSIVCVLQTSVHTSRTIKFPGSLCRKRKKPTILCIHWSKHDEAQILRLISVIAQRTMKPKHGSDSLE